MGEWWQRRRGWTVAVAVVAVVACVAAWAVRRPGEPAKVAISGSASDGTPSPTVGGPPSAQPTASPSDLEPERSASPAEATGPAVTPPPPPPTTPVATSSPEPAPQLVVTVTIDRAHYYDGELPVATARVCNPSDHEHAYERLEEDPWSFYVRDGDGAGLATSPEADEADQPIRDTFAPRECRERSWTWDRRRDEPHDEPAEPATYRIDSQYLVRTVDGQPRQVAGYGESAWFSVHDEQRPDTEPAPPDDPGPDRRVEVTVTTDRPIYYEGEVVRISISVCNTTDETQYHRADREDPVTWAAARETAVGPSGGRSDIYATGGNQEDGGDGYETVTMRFEPGECRVFEFEWDQMVQYVMDDDPSGAQVGERAPAGVYRVSAHWEITSWSSETDREAPSDPAGHTTIELR